MIGINTWSRSLRCSHHDKKTTGVCLCGTRNLSPTRVRVAFRISCWFQQAISNQPYLCPCRIDPARHPIRGAGGSPPTVPWHLALAIFEVKISESDNHCCLRFRMLCVPLQALGHCDPIRPEVQIARSYPAFRFETTIFVSCQ